MCIISMIILSYHVASVTIGLGAYKEWLLLLCFSLVRSQILGRCGNLVEADLVSTDDP